MCSCVKTFLCWVHNELNTYQKPHAIEVWRGGVPEISMVDGFDVCFKGWPVSTGNVTRWIWTVESEE